MNEYNLTFKEVLDEIHNSNCEYVREDWEKSKISIFSLNNQISFYNELFCHEPIAYSITPEAIEKKYCRIEKEFVKDVVIIGGGNVGLKLAKNLEDLKLNLKIIEKDSERCEYLSQVLDNALIINGDGTDLGLLNEEDIGLADVVVSVTNNDEKNLLCSLLVKHMGAGRVISRVSKNTNVELFEKVGIDIAISSRTAALNEIKNSIKETNIDILATVEQGKGEVLVIEIPENYQTKKIMDLKLPAKAIVGVIQRRKRIIIPNGATQVMGGDNLIIFTTSENAKVIREFFEEIE